MPDFTAIAADLPLDAGQYRFVQTTAWWLGMENWPGHTPFVRRVENVLRTWIPADPADEWLLDRQLTGREEWLAGSREEAAAAGIQLRPTWPTGQWRATNGDFYRDDPRHIPGPAGPSWHRPTPEFFAGVPLRPRELYDRLVAESPKSQGAAPSALTALRTGLVPAAVRAALYQALLLAPGAELIGSHPVVLAVPAGLHHYEIRIDPRDGQFLGERQSARTDDAETGLPAGTVGTDTEVRTAVVDELGRLPAQ